MKFRDGMWLVAEGKRVEYAEEVYRTTRTDKGLRLLCPTKKIYSRGDTLNTATLTIDIEAVSEGVISVETTHWAGAADRGPHFELYPDSEPRPEPRWSSSSSPSSSSGGTTLSSGSLSATVSSKPHTFDIRFHAATGDEKQQKELTSLRDRSVGFACTPAPAGPLATEDMRRTQHHVFTQTQLGVGESAHGLGERFGAFDKVGQSVALWNADGGTSSDQAYKNVGFWLSSRGYGVFVDHAGRVELEVGSERCSRVQTSVPGQRLRWLLIAGPSPRDVLARHALLVGRCPEVPRWSYGLWLSTSFTTNYDEATVASFLGRMRREGIPVDVFHLDCFWMRAFAWTDFVFDPQRFPDPAGQIARLKASGLVRKVCAWVNPYIAQGGDAFRHAADRGYLLRRRSDGGSVWQWDLWQAGMGLVDFTNPDAAAWFAERVAGLLDVGVDALKTDFGERVPTRDVAWHDPDVDPDKMHNFYAFLFNRTVHEAILEHSRSRRSRDRRSRSQAEEDGGGGGGGGETERAEPETETEAEEETPVLFARAACAGTQRFPLVWGGDCESTPEAMAESIRGGLSLGICGYAFWSNDIGGFEGRPEPWLYKRWVAFGLLCSHSRLHGSSSYRVPWLIDGKDDNDDDDDDDDSEQEQEEEEQGEDSCTRTLARWTALKAELAPYLLRQARLAVRAGLPLSLRAMCLEFPDDPTSWHLDRQFMVGDRLLAAPVFTEAGDVEFYLPEGTWHSYFGGDSPGGVRSRVGPGWFRETHGFATMPLYVRGELPLVQEQD